MPLSVRATTVAFVDQGIETVFSGGAIGGDSNGFLQTALSFFGDLPYQPPIETPLINGESTIIPLSSKKESFKNVYSSLRPSEIYSIIDDNRYSSLPCFPKTRPLSPLLKNVRHSFTVATKLTEIQSKCIPKSHSFVISILIYF